MKNRLEIARELLKDDGVIFIHLDDNEIHYLKVMCDEIFGRENFIATIPRKTRTGKSDVPYKLSQDFDYLVCYTNAHSSKTPLFKRSIARKYYKSDDFPNDEWRLNPMTKQTTIYERPNSNFTIINPKNGQEFPVNPQRSWAVTKETFPKYLAENKIVFPDDYDFLKISQPMLRVFKSEEINNKGDDYDKAFVSSDFLNQITDELAKNYRNEMGTSEIIDLFGSKIFSYPKPMQLIKRILEVTTSKDDIILDFFAGSGTTAHAVLELNRQDNGNRKFILIEQMDYAKTITAERIKRVMQRYADENPMLQPDESFVYCELAPMNQKYIEQIQNAESFHDLENMLTELKQNQEKIQFDYRINIDEFQIDADFLNLDFGQQKEVFISLFDKNMTYIPFSEIKDSQYEISKEDQILNELFYSEDIDF